MKMDWKAAEVYARRLFDESRWSKCIYAYVQAAYLCMQQEEGTISEADRRRLCALMKYVALLLDFFKMTIPEIELVVFFRPS